MRKSFPLYFYTKRVHFQNTVHHYRITNGAVLKAYPEPLPVREGETRLTSLVASCLSVCPHVPRVLFHPSAGSTQEPVSAVVSDAAALLLPSPSPAVPTWAVPPPPPAAASLACPSGRDGRSAEPESGPHIDLPPTIDSERAAVNPAMRTLPGPQPAPNTMTPMWPEPHSSSLPQPSMATVLPVEYNAGPPPGSPLVLQAMMYSVEPQSNLPPPRAGPVGLPPALQALLGKMVPSPVPVKPPDNLLPAQLNEARPYASVDVVRASGPPAGSPVHPRTQQQVTGVSEAGLSLAPCNWCKVSTTFSLCHCLCICLRRFFADLLAFARSEWSRHVIVR